MRSVHLPRSALRAAAVALSIGLLAVTACSDGSDGDDAAIEDRPRNPGVLPTLAGGVELEAVDPSRVLVAEGLSFGAPLPSEQAAAEAFLAFPEVRAALARRVHSLATGRLVADVVVLSLDGAQIFDAGVLDAFADGVVAGLADAPTTEVAVGDRTTVRATGAERAVEAFREGDLLVLVDAPVVEDAAVVVSRQLDALAAGATGSLEPFTPLVALPVDAAFVPVPTVAFEPFAAPPEPGPPVFPEPPEPPEAPGLPGATAVQGRFGVVAGEQRTTVWSYTLDPAVYPSAEALAPALSALASSRAGGAATTLVEVGGRVVHVAVGGPEQPSATAFRHQGLALLVEGTDPAQVDAVVTAWLAAL
ncbi:MAG: hypothetical protein ACSLFP_18205 [Acidimicrobiales bacterium]